MRERDVRMHMVSDEAVARGAKRRRPQGQTM
jgi:hypothetical protein